MDCGRGTRNRRVSCRSLDTGEEVGENRCGGDEKPEEEATCVQLECRVEEDDEEEEEDKHNDIHEVRVTHKKSKMDLPSPVSVKVDRVISRRHHKTPRYRWKVGPWEKVKSCSNKMLDNYVLDIIV